MKEEKNKPDFLNKDDRFNYQDVEKPHYDNTPYESKDPYKHKWPRKLLISYAIDWFILLAGLAAMSYSIWWMVNH